MGTKEVGIKRFNKVQNFTLKNVEIALQMKVDSVTLVLFDTQVRGVKEISRYEDAVKFFAAASGTYGQTNIWDTMITVLDRAIKSHPYEEKIKLIFLTDGEHTVKKSKYKKEDMIRLYLEYFASLQKSQNLQEFYVWYYQLEGAAKEDPQWVDVLKEFKNNGIQVSSYIEFKPAYHVALHINMEPNYFTATRPTNQQEKITIPFTIEFNWDNKEFPRSGEALFHLSISETSGVKLNWEGAVLPIKVRAPGVHKGFLQLSNYTGLEDNRPYPLLLKCELVNRKEHPRFTFSGFAEEKKCQLILSSQPLISIYPPAMHRDLKIGTLLAVPITMYWNSPANNKAVTISADYKENLHDLYLYEEATGKQLLGETFTLNATGRSRFYLQLTLKKVLKAEPIKGSVDFVVAGGNSQRFNLNIYPMRGQVLQASYQHKSTVDILPNTWHEINTFWMDVDLNAYEEEIVMQAIPQDGVEIDVKDLDGNSILGKPLGFSLQTSVDFKVFFRYDIEQIALEAIQPLQNYILLSAKEPKRLKLPSQKRYPLPNTFKPHPSPYHIYLDQPTDGKMSFQVPVIYSEEKEFHVSWNEKAIGREILFHLKVPDGLRFRVFSTAPQEEYQSQAKFKMGKERKQIFQIQCQPSECKSYLAELTLAGVGADFPIRLPLLFEVQGVQPKVKVDFPLTQKNYTLNFGELFMLERAIDINPINIRGKENLNLRISSSVPEAKLVWEGSDTDAVALAIPSVPVSLGMKVCYNKPVNLKKEPTPSSIEFNLSSENPKIEVEADRQVPYTFDCTPPALQYSLKKSWQYGIPQKKPAIFELQIEKKPGEAALALLANETITIEGTMEKKYENFSRTLFPNGKLTTTMAEFLKQPEFKIELKTGIQGILDPLKIPVEILLSSDSVHTRFALEKTTSEKVTVYVVVPPLIPTDILALAILGLLGLTGGILLIWAKSSPLEVARVASPQSDLWVTAEVNMKAYDKINTTPPKDEIEKNPQSDVKLVESKDQPLFLEETENPVSDHEDDGSGNDSTFSDKP
jgi:hypothetical protein